MPPEMHIAERVHQLARGCLRAEESLQRSAVENRKSDAIWKVILRLLGELNYIMTGNEKSNAFPDTLGEFPKNANEFVGKYARTGMERRYSVFSKGIGDRPPRIVKMRSDVQSLFAALENESKDKAAAFSEILVRNDTDSPPVFLDLMLSGANIAQKSDEFRRAFHSAMAPMTIGNVEHGPQHTLMYRVSAPLADYRSRSQELLDIAPQGDEILIAHARWISGDGNHPYRNAAENKSCFENYGDHRLLPWMLHNFSGEAVKITPEMRTTITRHANHYAFSEHTAAATKLNSNNHTGAQEYFVAYLLEIIVQLYRLDCEKRNDIAASQHRVLLRQQRDVLIHAMNQSYIPNTNRTAQSTIEEELMIIERRRPELAPYISPITSLWSDLEESGKILVAEFNRQHREQKESAACSQSSADVIAVQNANEILAHRVLGMGKIVTMETQSAGWEQPLEFLSARIQCNQICGILYHRATYRSDTQKPTLADQFEMELLKRIARDHGIETWAFTVANWDMLTVANWAVEQGITITPRQLRREIQAWLYSGSDGTDLRLHLQRNCGWPTPMDAQEDATITQQINYWQLLCKTKCELEEEDIEPNIMLSFASISDEDCNHAAKFLRNSTTPFIDVGGMTAKYIVSPGDLPREAFLAIDHRNTLISYPNKDFSLKKGFRAGAQIAGNRSQFGSPHQTSAMEFKDNGRLVSGLKDDVFLMNSVDQLPQAFTLQGKELYDEPVDVVLFTPHGNAGAGVAEFADSEDDREPVCSGSGGRGWNGGGDGAVGLM